MRLTLESAERRLARSLVNTSRLSYGINDTLYKEMMEDDINFCYRDSFLNQPTFD